MPFLTGMEGRPCLLLQLPRWLLEAFLGGPCGGGTKTVGGNWSSRQPGGSCTCLAAIFLRKGSFRCASWRDAQECICVWRWLAQRLSGQRGPLLDLPTWAVQEFAFTRLRGQEGGGAPDLLLRGGPRSRFCACFSPTVLSSTAAVPSLARGSPQG